MTTLFLVVFCYIRLYKSATDVLTLTRSIFENC